MSDVKKYYYMKFKDNFFDSDEMLLLEAMPDGYLYSNILIKLYLKSIKNNGKLMFMDTVPYNASMISTIIKHNVGVVEKALKIFSELGLIDVLDNGEIFMLHIQNFIGASTNEADRIRKYRNSIKSSSGEKIRTNVHQRLEFRAKSLDIRDKSIEEDICQDKIENKEKVKKSKNPHIQEIFDFWISTMDLKRAVLNESRTRLIEKALNVFNVEDLKNAIKGCANSSWHMGKNDANMKYNSISLILRNNEKIESFIQLSTVKKTKKLFEALHRPSLNNYGQDGKF